MSQHRQPVVIVIGKARINPVRDKVRLLLHSVKSALVVIGDEGFNRGLLGDGEAEGFGVSLGFQQSVSAGLSGGQTPLATE